MIKFKYKIVRIKLNEKDNFEIRKNALPKIDVQIINILVPSPY